MAYTLTIQDNAVYIVNTLGYNATVQGFGRCQARIPSAGAIATGEKTWIEIYDDSGFVIKIATDDFDTIGGDSPESTASGLVLQINSLFSAAYPGGGGGSGSGSFLTGTGTSGTTFTNATLIGSNVVGLAVNNTFNNADFTFDPGTGTITLTGGFTFADGDEILVLYIPS